MRVATVSRKTNETDISITLGLDGAGGAGAVQAGGDAGGSAGSQPRAGEVGSMAIDTGCGFLNHMLNLFARHGGFCLTVRAAGDTAVDCHHLTEDVGIVLGQAFREALGEGRGIARYGSALLPMDEALLLIALDISGRAWLEYDADIRAPKVGDFDTELAREFMLAFSRALPLTLHVRQLAGTNAHHIIEAMFKGLARAMRQAVAVGGGGGGGGAPGELPSTKGLLL